MPSALGGEPLAIAAVLRQQACPTLPGSRQELLSMVRLQLPDYDAACPACAAPLSAAFCSNCGQPRARRLDARQIRDDVWEQFSELNFPLLQTLRRLLLAPGPFLQAYLGGRRLGLVTPVRFFFIWVTVAVAITLGLNLPLSPPIDTSRFNAELAVAIARMPEFAFTFRAYFSFVLLLPLAWLASRLWRASGMQFAEACAVLPYASALACLLQLGTELITHLMLGLRSEFSIRVLSLSVSEFWLLHALLGGHWLANLGRVSILVLVHVLLAAALVISVLAAGWWLALA